MKARAPVFLMPGPSEIRLAREAFVTRILTKASHAENERGNPIRTSGDREARSDRRIDVAEIANYVSALRYGMDRVEALPLSLRLIRDIHEVLMTGVRGGEPSRTPGEFRASQNWIGGPTPATARFVPPPVDEMHRCLDELERFLHGESELPLLIRVGIAHAFFETNRAISAPCPGMLHPSSHAAARTGGSGRAAVPGAVPLTLQSPGSEPRW